MKLLWNSGKFLAYDMVASLFFIGLYAITKSLAISVGVGIAVGVAQIALGSGATPSDRSDAMAEPGPRDRRRPQRRHRPRHAHRAAQAEPRSM